MYVNTFVNKRKESDWALPLLDWFWMWVQFLNWALSIVIIAEMTAKKIDRAEKTTVEIILYSNKQIKKVDYC